MTHADRTLLRIGSAFAVVGSVIAIVAIILHPKIGELDYGDFGYEESFLQTIADSPEWEIVHILVLFSALLFTGALLAVRRSSGANPARPGPGWAS